MPFRQGQRRVSDSNQCRYMFGIQVMTVDITAIGSPQIVKMRFDKETEIAGSSNKDLPINRPVSIFNRGCKVTGDKFSRQYIAVTGSKSPGRLELLEDGLFEVVR